MLRSAAFLLAAAGLFGSGPTYFEVSAKYEGYIARMRADVARFRQAEGRIIPPDLDYASEPGLSAEIKERLSAVRPRSLGQASRIPGMTPAGVSILMVWSHRQATSR